MSLDDKINWSLQYIGRGWPVFVLGRDKTPLPNCATCQSGGGCPGRGACGHLTCHGFYAATTDERRIEQILYRNPDGMLAVRTGDGLCVLDFEGTERGQETYDQFEAYTGGVELPRGGLAQRTGGGGIHVFLDVQANLIKSRNRVLPDMDVKASGGYVAVGPSEDGRGWLNDGVRMGWETDVPLATSNMLGWLTTARGNFGAQGGAQGGSGIAGGDWYVDALKNGCPGGLRDEFFNRLIFSQRKLGVERDKAEETIFQHWEKCQQATIGKWVGATWDMPKEHVEYKIDRIWATVEPDKLSPGQLAYMDKAASFMEVGESKTMGSRTLVKRGWGEA